MRVLFVIPAFVPAYGGPYFVLKGLLPALQERGAEVSVLTTDLFAADGSRGSISESHPFPVQRLPAQLHYHWASFSPVFVSQMSRSLRDVDLVHICGYRDGLGAVASWQAQRQNVPVVWEPMGMSRAAGRSRKKKVVFDRIIGTRTLARAFRLIATSPIEEKELASTFLGVAKRVACRANGLDPLPAIYQKGAPGEWQQIARKKLGWSRQDRRVINLGRIEARKGLVYLAQRICEQPDLQLVLVGPDEGDGTLQEIRRILGNRVLIPGSVWGDERFDWLAAADCFALPSHYGENFAIAALEAAAVGTPVLLSPEVGCGAMLPPAAVTILRHDEPQKWNQVLYATTNRIPRDDVAHLRDCFSWPALAGEQMTIYCSLLGIGSGF